MDNFSKHLEKGTFISSVSPYPEEEYYLSKSSWSTTAADWDQRFEVGDIVADPSGSWEPSTAQQYIDGQIAGVNTNLTSEVIARQTGDHNLQTNLQSEMNTRASQDANLNALINAGIREGGGVEFDIVPTQNSANGITSGGMYSTLKDPNIGFVEEVPTAGSDNLVNSTGIERSIANSCAYYSQRSITFIDTLDKYFINRDNIDYPNDYAAINTYSLQNIKVLHVVMRYSGENNRFLFYDNSDNIISSGFLPQLPAAPAKHDTFIYVPDGAVKFRTGYIKAQGITVEDGSTDRVIDDNYEEVNNRLIPYLEYNNTIFGKIYWGINHDPVWQDVDSFVFTKLRVYGNQPVVYIKAFTGTAPICFFDVNNNEVSSVPSGTSQNPIFEGNVVVPNNAVYVGFSHKINANAEFLIAVDSKLSEQIEDTVNKTLGTIELTGKTVGKRVDAKLNGAYVDNSAWDTLIYRVSGSMLPIHITGRLGSMENNNASVVFCDSDDNVISSIQATTTTESGDNVNMDYIIPFGTVKIKATSVPSNPTVITYSDKSLNTKVNNNEAYGDIEYQSTLLGSYINKDGETVALNNHFAIATYKLYGLPLVHFELRCNQNLFTVFYDKDGNSLMMFSSIGGVAHDDTFNLQAPVGAVTMKVSYLTSDFRHVIRPAYPTNTLLEKVSSESIGNAVFDSTEGGYYMNEYFEKTANSGFSLDKYIIHQGLNTIHIKARIGTNTYIVFYDANDIAIKGYAGNSDEGVNVDSDFNVPSNASYVVISYATWAGCEVKVNSLVANANDSKLKGKKIVWLGTSIPATGSTTSYPNKVGKILGATVYNEALGSSLMRIGRINHTTGDPLGDEFGLTGWYWIAFVRALSYTQKEKIYVMERWTTEQRQAKLIEEGYTPQQVASVVGYRELMNNDQDKPATITPGSSTWNDALAWCWDSNGGQNIEGKIQKYLNPENEPDLWVFDHMRNDFANGSRVSETKDQDDTVPINIEDRHYPIGAMVYLIHKIWAYNPKAKIVIISHYTQATLSSVYIADKCCDAQKKVSDLLGVPFIPWFENSGVNDYSVMTVGYWDSNNEWQDSGYNGTDNIVDYNIYPINENDRTLTEADGCFASGTRVHDLSTRFINMRDGVHPEYEPTRQRWAEKLAGLITNFYEG